MPHVVIAGAGAMGCLFGGLLAEGGLDVTLLARRLAQVDAIRTHGLRMVGHGGERTIPVRAALDVADIPAADAVLFQCKAYDTAAVALAVRPLFGRGCLAVSFQNGLDNEERIAAALGDGAVVLGGFTALAATLEAPGVVRGYASLPTVLGEMAGGLSPRARDLAALLSAHGLPVTASADIVAEKWAKLLLNVGLSATSALTDLAIGDVLAIASLRHVSERAMAEARAVAAACGVGRTAAPELSLFDAMVGSGAATNRTSMCRDIHARRRTEVDAIYRSVIRRGQAHGVPTPTLDTLAALMDGLEQRHG